MAEHLITPTYWLGQEVFLKTDTDCSPGIVNAIIVMGGLCYKYVVSFGFHTRECFEVELEAECSQAFEQDDDDEDESPA